VVELNEDMRKAFDECEEKGRIAYNTEDYTTMITIYQEMLDLLQEPKCQWAWSGLNVAGVLYGGIGGGYLRKKNYQKSLSYFLQALECWSDNSLYNFRVGEIYFDMGKEKEASPYLRKAWDISEGRTFSDKDPKYLFFLKSKE